MDVRPYEANDLAACLAVFDSNVPEYFDAAERAEFEEFLTAGPLPYVVLQNDGAIVGCGGWELVADEKLASLTWGMVRRDLHRQGLGRFLLLYRLREVTKAGVAARVRIDTSQRTSTFYYKQGFKVVDIEADGYAPGLDCIEMVMKLNVCA